MPYTRNELVENLINEKQNLEQMRLYVFAPDAIALPNIHFKTSIN